MDALSGEANEDTADRSANKNLIYNVDRQNIPFLGMFSLTLADVAYTCKTPCFRDFDAVKCSLTKFNNKEMLVFVWWTVVASLVASQVACAQSTSLELPVVCSSVQHSVADILCGALETYLSPFCPFLLYLLFPLLTH